MPKHNEGECFRIPHQLGRAGEAARNEEDIRFARAVLKDRRSGDGNPDIR